MQKLVLSDLHESIGGKMVEFAGYYMPLQYEGINAEHQAVREEVGVFDVSHMGEVFVSGDKALDFLQHITSNDVIKRLRLLYNNLWQSYSEVLVSSHILRILFIIWVIFSCW